MGHLEDLFKVMDLDLAAVDAAKEEAGKVAAEKAKLEAAIKALPGFANHSDPKKGWITVTLANNGKVNTLLDLTEVTANPDLIRIVDYKTVIKAALALDPGHPFVKSEAERLQESFRTVVLDKTIEKPKSEQGEEIDRLFILMEAIGTPAANAVAINFAKMLHRRFGRLPHHLWLKYGQEVVKANQPVGSNKPFTHDAAGADDAGGEWPPKGVKPRRRGNPETFEGGKPSPGTKKSRPKKGEEGGSPSAGGIRADLAGLVVKPKPEAKPNGLAADH